MAETVTIERVPPEAARPDYMAMGKEVLRNGEHFADAVSAEAAILIVIAMGGPRIIEAKEISA